MTSRNRRRLRTWGIAAAIVFAAYAAAAWYAAGELTAPVPREVFLPKTGRDISNIALETAAGRVAGWYVRPRRGPRGIAVLLHGVRGDRTQMWPRADWLAGRGWASVLVDLPAHGESEGDAITLGRRERHAARAAVDFARERHPDGPVAVVGVSLGGAATVLALADGPLDVDGLVLESVFPTVTAAVGNRTGRVPYVGGLLSRSLLVQMRPRLGVSPADLRPVDHLAAAGCPVLVLSGRLDDGTTPADTRRLFAAAAEPKALHFFAAAGHEDLHAHSPEEYERRVAAFLDGL